MQLSFWLSTCGLLLSKFEDYLFTRRTLTGPVMTKFTVALREIGTYKEVLRSQVYNV